MQTAKCPVCHSDVVIGDDAFLGDIVECANCNSISETTALHPMSLNVIEDNSGVEETEEE